MDKKTVFLKIGQRNRPITIECNPLVSEWDLLRSAILEAAKTDGHLHQQVDGCQILFQTLHTKKSGDVIAADVTDEFGTTFEDEADLIPVFIPKPKVVPPVTYEVVAEDNDSVQMLNEADFEKFLAQNHLKVGGDGVLSSIDISETEVPNDKTEASSKNTDAVPLAEDKTDDTGNEKTDSATAPNNNENVPPKPMKRQTRKPSKEVSQ